MISFGRYEVDLDNRIVRKAGLIVRLAPQPFTVMAALLEAGGKVVTCEELRRQLWPDGTFLEYEQAINVAVRRLRETLGESGSNPIYIETIPRVGYRWLIPLQAATRTSETRIILPLGPVDTTENSDGPFSRLLLGPEPELPELPVAKRFLEPHMPPQHGRWKIASAVLAVSVAGILGTLIVRSRTAGPALARSVFAWSSILPGEIPITRDAPTSKCLDFAGRWRTTPDLSEMQISQSGCAIRGSFVSADGAYQHTLAGDSRWGEATVVVERTDIRNCRTEMSVTFYLDTERDLTYVVNGTAGRCELRENYRETRVWKPVSF